MYCSMHKRKTPSENTVGCETKDPSIMAADKETKILVGHPSTPKNHGK